VDEPIEASAVGASVTPGLALDSALRLATFPLGIQALRKFQVISGHLVHSAIVTRRGWMYRSLDSSGRQ
jgi:hypothetical protein